MKLLRIVAVLALLTGTALTARSGYLDAKAELASILIHRAWEQSVRTGRPVLPWSWADTYPVARLRIPALGYDEIVLEGATPRTLAFGPARLQSGSAFGQAGNIVLAGHRTSWFRSLEETAPGHRIEVEWFDSRARLHRRTYRVHAIKVVDPADTALLQPTPDDVLTLITCYPFGPRPTSPQRFIVQARPAADLPKN